MSMRYSHNASLTRRMTNTPDDWGRVKPSDLDIIPDCLVPAECAPRPPWEEPPPPVAGWWLLWSVLGLVVWMVLGVLIWHTAGPTVCLLWADGSWSCLG